MIIFLLILMTVLAILAVWLNDLLRGVICLAAVSALLAAVIYHFEAPYAAVFELSVAAGLITVLFISAISLLRPPGESAKEVGIASYDENKTKAVFGEDAKETRMLKYLPVAVIIFAVILWMIKKVLPSISYTTAAKNLSLGEVLWGVRTFDLFGQIIVILCGVFLVIVFFKERKV